MPPTAIYVNAIETKTVFRKRLNAEGNWSAFMDIRERLKAAGMVGGLAWKEAAKAFPPPELKRLNEDGSPMDPIAAAIRAVGIPAGPSAPGEPIITQAQIKAEAMSALADEHVDNSKFMAPSAPMKMVLEWVSRNLTNTEAEPSECPSPAAWGMRRWVWGSPAAQAKFWDYFYKEASKKEDRQEAIREDLATKEDLLDQLNMFIEMNPDEVLTGL